MPKKASKDQAYKNIDFVDCLSCGVAFLQILPDDAGQVDEFRVEYANQAFSKMCGRSQEGLSKQNLADLFDDNLEDWRQFFADCLKKQGMTSFQSCLPGDKKRYYLVASRMINAHHLLVDLQDITVFLNREPKAEKIDPEEVNLEKSTWQGSFDAVGDVVEIIDPDFRVIYRNKSARNTRGSRIGGFCYELRQRTSICDNCPAFSAFELGIVQRAVNVLNSEGATKYIDVVASPVFDENRGVSAVIKIVRDVTEMKNVDLAKERLIKEQQKAMAEVKKLSGLLTMCSQCKSIKGNGNWYELENYLRGHSEVEFDRALCPKCKGNLKKETKNLSV